jgi:hypothetical protein
MCMCVCICKCVEHFRAILVRREDSRLNHESVCMCMCVCTYVLFHISKTLPSSASVCEHTCAYMCMHAYLQDCLVQVASVRSLTRKNRIFVCTHVFAYIYMCVCVCFRIDMFSTYKFMHTFTYTYEFKHSFTCTYEFMHSFTYTNEVMHTFTCTHVSVTKSHNTFVASKCTHHSRIYSCKHTHLCVHSFIHSTHACMRSLTYALIHIRMRSVEKEYMSREQTTRPTHTRSMHENYICICKFASTHESMYNISFVICC